MTTLPVDSLSTASVIHPLPAAPAIVRPRRRGTRLAGRALVAGLATVATFAAAHLAILAIHAARTGDVQALDLFSILEAGRLWPALEGSGLARASGLLVPMVFTLLLATLGRRHAIVRARPRRAERGRVSETPPRPSAPRRRPLTVREAPRSPAPGRPASAAVLHFRSPGAPAAPSLGLGVLALAGGLTVHMLALAAIEGLVPAFPAVPDVVHERLPYVDFGVPGELAFGVFLAAIVAVLVRRQPATVPPVLVQLGVFYGLRGLFLFLLPIGAPPTAPPLGERFVFWPFAGHAYFPGGHTGMMTVLSLAVASTVARRAFLAATALFAIGTLLARTHYAADALAGGLLGYAIVLRGRHRSAAARVATPAAAGT